MFRTLRSKLVLSHFLVILAAFVLTAAIASVPIRRVQEARLRGSLVLSSESVARQIDLSRAIRAALDTSPDTTQAEFAQRVLDAEEQRSGNRLLLLDQDGQVVLDSDPSRSLQGQNLPEVSAAINDLASRLDRRTPPGRAAQRIALAVESMSISAGTIDEREVVVATTGASAIPNRQDFYIAAWAPRRSAPLIDDFVRPLALAALVGLVVSVILGILIARSITKPLRELTASVASIRATDLDERIHVDGGGEVGTLVAAFNNMLDRMASTYRSQRDLLANIAHELRTPLTSIQGYSQALSDRVISDEAARIDAISAISDESRRMTELVEQIMQLSRIESGHLPARFAEVDIGELLTQLERRFAPIANQHGVALRVHTESSLRCVLDAELLLQALGNLVSNAIRHTAENGRVTVRASRVAAPERSPRLQIMVRDSGEGIDEQQLERIFDRFYRTGDAPSPGDARNFGLGLAIVQEIVKRHRGEISVLSEPDEGTTFTIDLPLDIDPTESATP